MSANCRRLQRMCSLNRDRRIYAMDGCGYGIVLLGKEDYNSFIEIREGTGYEGI